MRGIVQIGGDPVVHHRIVEQAEDRLAKAGGGKADPAVRVIIDGQNSIERKNRGFADRVLFWKDGQAIGPDGQPLDPDQESRRQKAVQSATGGNPVEIERRPTGAKLPGL